MKINMNNYVRLGPSYSMVEKYENTNTEQNHHSLGVQKACTKGILWQTDRFHAEEKWDRIVLINAMQQDLMLNYSNYLPRNNASEQEGGSRWVFLRYFSVIKFQRMLRVEVEGIEMMGRANSHYIETCTHLSWNAGPAGQINSTVHDLANSRPTLENVYKNRSSERWPQSPQIFLSH